MESNDELKEIDIKSCTCYYFDGIINIEDFNLDNILIDEKSYGNILVYDISYKSIIDSKPLRIKFNKIDRFIRVYDELDVQYYLEVKNMITFTTELDIL